MENLDKKYALVTGAFGGMGRETIKLLTSNGYTVFALDKTILEQTDNVIPIKADLSLSEDVASAFNQVKAVTNHLHAIVHFAGVYMLNSLVEISDDEFDKILKINLYIKTCPSASIPAASKIHQSSNKDSFSHC